MGIEVASYEDLYKKLHGTICLYAGVPVLVQCNERGSMDLVIYPIDEKTELKKTKIKCTDEDLEVYDIPLGYYYNGSVCSFITRTTRRTYNQGISTQNLNRQSIKDIGGLSSPAFSKCILGFHPSVDEAFKTVKDDGAEKVPFHRNFAFYSDGSQLFIMYRDRTIAYNDAGGMSDFRLFNSNDTSLILRELDKNGYRHLLG